ncbi:uncharacterized protein Z520_00762 [Fonsecaea multimorphosa CBS 102226]|uniref:Xylanolytic transcriptional activator regulatory domain-containing protein n=1 Tax=Fonsecaea multimorphosa CBS 102226 TaxID=1442371 RepID=A0A0D2KKQ4_9EURO|nr:uncharacterized protein Z520_00762 [Fonsecaea multimorphosa CBS 102226]KIY04070.1 hypothetical protein Z520_00762 [Fonsecaea multimorphosa CBS 102226]
MGNGSENAPVATTITSETTGLFENDFVSILEATDFNSNLDWLFERMPDDSLADLTNFYGVKDTHVASSAQSPREGHKPDGQPSRDPAIPELPIPHAENSVSPDDPWPMEWHAEHPQRSLELPALGGTDDEATQSLSRFFSAWNLGQSTVEALAHFIKLPAQRSPWQSVNLTHFPTKEKLEYCIDRYFAHFHLVCPIIHQATFDPSDDLTVTLAIASIGACYTHYNNAKAFSSTLSELNRRLLLFLAEYDRRYVRTESYLAAQLLQGLHGYCSGNKRLFELSESSRSNLVHHAKCMGLFRHRPDSNPGSLPATAVEERWRDWIHQERLLRLGWAVYEYDASVAYLHNNRPFLTIGDIHMDLPCLSQYWQAESAHSWHAMLLSAGYPSRIRLRPLIRSFYDKSQNALERLVEERHRYILVLTQVRMIWTLKEITGSPICDLFVNGPENCTADLLDATDRFARSPHTLSSSLTTTELASAIHTLQIIHVAHLYGANGLMNWLYPLLREGNEATTAFTQMSHWAAAKPEMVRNTAFHCARILSLARTYPSNCPDEPFLIFHAGTVLFYLARWLPRNTGAGSSENLVVRLDHIGAEDDTESANLRSWLRDGQAQVISLHGIPSLCSNQGRRQVLDETADLLKRRRVWGIANSFVKVVLNLRDTSKPVPDQDFIF